jgi:hypothetical protein
MKRAIFILGIFLIGCNQWPSAETVTEILETAEALARCTEIANQCVETLKPKQNFDEALPVLLECKDQLLENGCKDSIENLL